jgi:hypothetical protein
MPSRQTSARLDQLTVRLERADVVEEERVRMRKYEIVASNDEFERYVFFLLHVQFHRVCILESAERSVSKDLVDDGEHFTELVGLQRASEILSTLTSPSA